MLYSSAAGGQLPFDGSWFQSVNDFARSTGWLHTPARGFAQYGVGRDGLPGPWPSGYDDAAGLYTPAWQEAITGVPALAVSRIAREFAVNNLPPALPERVTEMPHRGEEHRDARLRAPHLRALVRDFRHPHRVLLCVES